MPKSALLAAVAASLLLVLQPALAQRNLAVTAPPATEQRVALVIGNSTYKEAPLANPVNDATDMAAVLRTYGFRVIQRTNVRQRDMRNAIREFAAELRRAEVGLFYFAGHGVQVRGTNYLVPVDADVQSEADAEDLSIDANYVLRTMEEAQAKVSIMILDACRNNPFPRSFRSANRGLAQMSAATGSLVAFATAPGSVAADGKQRNGIYTKHLLANLRADDTDILRVFQRTRAAVVRETGGRQTPWESTSLIGEFHFRPGVKPGMDPAVVELEFWNAVKDSKSADELKAYVEHYPSGRFVALAHARLNALPASQAPAQVASVAPVNPFSGAALGASFRDCDDCPEMVVIPAGTFTMGSPPSERLRGSNEGPQRQVTVVQPFAAGKYEVTFDEWDVCMKEGGCTHNPDDGSSLYEEAGTAPKMSSAGRGRRPVILVSWEDAKQYVGWLSRKTGKAYRLLSEAEWEYVARAGSTTTFNTGVRINSSQANYNPTESYAGSGVGTARGLTLPVGSFPPNAFGLHDVHGNVWEWVEDCNNPDYNGAPSDGSAWDSGNCAFRILRGGSWFTDPSYLRSAHRGQNHQVQRDVTYGFRVGRSR